MIRGTPIRTRSGCRSSARASHSQSPGPRPAIRPAAAPTMPLSPTSAATCIAEPDVLDLLTRLVEKSLVVYEEDERGHGRYHLLETVRQYARDRLLGSGEGEAWRTSHRDHFLALAEE